MRPKKSLSQHFLKDKNILKKMVSKTDIKGCDTVIEIGSGCGNLTRIVKDFAGFVYAIEIDERFRVYLEDIEKESENVKVIYGDFLKIDLSQIPSSSPLKVIGNIPYGITGPIIFKLLSERRFISSCFLTLQKEVAERIVAPPRTRSYGMLSVLCQVLSEVKIEFTVPPQVFYPEPEVESAFISMKFRKETLSVDKSFIDFVKTCFRFKRKILLNSLKGTYGQGIAEKLLSKFKLPNNVRAEEIPPQIFLEMYNFLRHG